MGGTLESGFSYRKFFVEPSWWNFNCVSSLKFQILGQDGLEHIFDCYRSVCFSYFSIILLLKKKFQGKKIQII